MTFYLPGYFHCNIDIETKCIMVFQAFGKDAFSSIKRFPYRKMEKTWLYLLKKWILKKFKRTAKGLFN